MVIEIPNQIAAVQLSEKQRPLYYNYTGVTITAKKKTLPIRYVSERYIEEVLNSGKVQPHMLASAYKLLPFLDNKPFKGDMVSWQDYPQYRNGKPIMFYLCDANNNRILANPNVANTPKMKTINAQSVYNQGIDHNVRNKIVDAIKHNFLPYVNQLEKIHPEMYPLRAKLYLFDTVHHSLQKNQGKEGQRWDVGNRSYLYGKCMMDLLATGSIGHDNYFEPKIFDDDRLRLTEDCIGGIFCPVKDATQRKLVFILYSDNLYEYEDGSKRFYPPQIHEMEKIRHELLKQNEFYRHK